MVAAYWQPDPGITVDVFRTEQSYAGGAYVVDFQDPLGGELPLNAQEIVVDVRIANALGKDDSGQDRDIGVEAGPTRQIAGGLRANALSGVGRRAE